MKFICQGLVFNLAPEAIAQFEAVRQIRRNSPETGGQLFAHFSKSGVEIVSATLTKGNSTRGRFWFRPDRATERMDIEMQFSEGFHYVGDWHTHAETYPQPSAADVSSMVDIYTNSQHELQGLLLVIVGRSRLPRGLFVGFVNDEGVSRCDLAE